MPSQKFRANPAYLQLATIAENCMQWFKKLLPINWQHNAMQTLRHKLIHHGASVSFKKQICTLRLNASYRYKTEVEAIYQNLTQEIEFAKLAKHQALDKFRK